MEKNCKKFVIEFVAVVLFMSVLGFNQAKANDEKPSCKINKSTQEVVHAYLALDIQNDLKSLKELQNKIGEVKSKSNSSWERYGNAYFLQLRPKVVVLKGYFNDEDVESVKERTVVLNYCQFETVLQSWSVNK